LPVELVQRDGRRVWIDLVDSIGDISPRGWRCRFLLRCLLGRLLVFLILISRLRAVTIVVVIIAQRIASVRPIISRVFFVVILACSARSR
jgi:hypothetical protein